MKALTTLWIAVLSVLLHAQEGTALRQQVEESDAVGRELSVPTIPALTFISSDPSTVSRPSGVKKLAASLYNAIDEESRVKQGLAIEVKLSEYLPIAVSPEDYRRNFLKYVYYNTQASLGTVATAGDDVGTDLGWGLRMTLYDHSDPMANKAYLNEFEQVMLRCAAPAFPGDQQSAEEIAECMSGADRPVKEDFARAFWNAGWLALAYAGGSRLSGSRLSGGTSIGHQVWLAGGVPLQHWGQLNYIARWAHQFNDRIAHYTQEAELGAKVLLGGSTFNVYGEFGYTPLINKDALRAVEMAEVDEVFKWTLGVEFRLTTGVWVVTGIGEQASRIVGQAGPQVLSGLRFGIADKAKLKR